MMYERIQGNDMYNAGPNIPFSLNVNNDSVEFENPSILLSSGTAAPKPINPASITGLDVNQYKQPVSYQYSAGIGGSNSFASPPMKPTLTTMGFRWTSLRR